VLAPQVTDWPRISNLTSGADAVLERPWLVAVLCIVAAGIVAHLPRDWRRSFAWIAAGALVFWLHAELLVAGQLPADLVGDSLLVEVVVTDFPRVRGSTTSMNARSPGHARVPSRLRLSWFDAPVAVHAGDRWIFELRLRPPHGNANPGGRDIERWLFRERSGATGYVVNGPHNRLLESGRPGLVLRIRQRFIERAVALAGSNESAAVLVAVTVGARHLVSADQWERYGRTGTSHLMAISGLHIGLAASGAYFVFLALAILLPGQRAPRDVALLAAFVAAAGYALLSGLALPARRAILMLACVTGMLLLRREPSPGPVLAAAALVIAAADPVSTMAPGFRLSFAAVAILIWLAAFRAGPVARRPAAVRFVGGLVSMQFALFFGLLPLTILSFDRLALPAPLLNLVAVPVFSLLTVPLALLGLLLDGPLAVLGDVLIGAAAATIELLEHLIMRADSLATSTRVAEIERAAWVAISGLLAWAVLPPGWPGRWVSWLAVAWLVCWKPTPPAAGCVRAAILDIGQGLAVVLQTTQRVVLYDSGPGYRSGGSAAEDIVLPYLSSRGIGRIDLAVISHPDSDHAGGLPAIEAALPVAVVAASGLEGRTRAPLIPCAAGTRWTWDGVDFAFLNPLPGAPPARNDASCVLLVAAGGRRILLTGDIERPAETRLVAAKAIPEVDVMTVPHHGSATSSTPAFVSAARPAYAVVSAARYNQWGFPKAAVTARWRSFGAEVLATGASGAILIDACDAGRGIEVREYRSLYRRIWHADN
jgi:competence protein ComEC